jgi:hypothetical protein
MENTLSTITIFPATLAEKSDFISKAKAEILSGNYDPLLIDLRLKMIEDCVEALRKDPEIKEAVVLEAARYGAKTFDVHGATFTQSERKNFQYASAGDSRYNDLIEQIETLKAELKEREKFLANLPEGGMVNPDTGEIIKRPLALITPVLTIKFK